MPVAHLPQILTHYLHDRSNVFLRGNSLASADGSRRRRLGGSLPAPTAAQTNFGSVNVGASTTHSVTVTIPSTATLGSISVVTQGATSLDFATAGAGTCAIGTNYEASQTCTVQVVFKPAFAGQRSGAVLLLDGSGNLMATSLLAGTGSGPQIAFGPGTASAIDPMVNGVAFKNPFGMAVDGKGDLFIADNDNGRVVEIPADGGAPIAIDPIVGGSGLRNPAEWQSMAPAISTSLTLTGTSS